MSDKAKEEQIDDMEAELKQYQAELDAIGQGDAMPVPEMKKSESFYTLAQEMIKTTDSTKIANLDDKELGKTRLSERGCKVISQIARYYDQPLVSMYFKNYAEIIASTSMGKKGFFVQLIVTSITKKITGASQSGKKGSWWPFGKKDNNTNPQGLESGGIYE